LRLCGAQAAKTLPFLRPISDAGAMAATLGNDPEWLGHFRRLGLETSAFDPDRRKIDVPSREGRRTRKSDLLSAARSLAGQECGVLFVADAANLIPLDAQRALAT
jgi:hypothetical protein